MEQYGLSDADTVDDESLRLTFEAFLRIKKDHYHKKYYIHSITLSFLRKVTLIHQFPYYLLPHLDAIYVFGVQTNTIIKLSGGDVVTWVDSYISSDIE